jgi:hypothetical protein
MVITAVFDSICNKNYEGRNEAMKNTCGTSSVIYGLGFIGAVIYLIQHAHTFVGGLVGFLEALVWPVFLVYKLFEFLKM